MQLDLPDAITPRDAAAAAPAGLQIERSWLAPWAWPLLCFYWPLIAFMTHWPRMPINLGGVEDIEPDKVVHAGIFTMLTTLLVAARPAGIKRSAYWQVTVAALAAGFYAYFDEYTQQFTGRDASIFDVAADLTGVLGVSLAVLLATTAPGWRARMVWSRLVLILVTPGLAYLAFWTGTDLKETALLLSSALNWSVHGDKAAHFICALALLWLLLAARPLGAKRRVSGTIVTLIAMAACGPLVEIVQKFTNRDFEWGDIQAHMFGYGVGVAGWLALLFATWLPRWLTVRSRGIAKPQAAVKSAAMGGHSVGVEENGAPTAAAAQSTPFVGDARTVSILTFASRITGLIRDRINATNFGQGGVADGLAYGFQVPNLFRRLFGEGALTAAFIPVYTDLLRNDRPLATQFASACLWAMAGILGAITVVVEIILFFLWQHAGTPDTRLTLELTLIMFPYMPLVCLVAMFGGILQVHGKFAPSAAQPILLNVVMSITMVWATHGVWGEGPLREVVPLVAWSVVAAGVWQFISQGTMMLRCQPLTRRFSGAGAPMRLMLVTFVPMLVALSVFQINTFLDTNIAFFLSPKGDGDTKLHLLGMVRDYPVPRGGVAAFTRAMLLYQFPLGVFGIAIATAIFPALAHAAAEKGMAGLDRFREILRHGLRLTMFIGLPASAGVFLVRVPLCRTIFEGKEFTRADAALDASILAGFAPAIWAYSMTHVLTRGFYSLKDSRTPMAVSLVSVVLNLLLNVTLVWFLGVKALAVSTALCAMLQCCVLLWLMRRQVDKPINADVVGSWTRTAILTTVMSAALFPIPWVYDPMMLSRWQAAGELTVMVLVGTAVFGIGAWLMKAPEIGWLLHRGEAGQG